MKKANNEGDDGPADALDMEVSPFVELLVARMKSHPEEFYQWAPDAKHTLSPHPKRSIGGMNQLIETTRALWNRKEKRMYNEALRELRMQEAYERLLHNLLK